MNSDDLREVECDDGCKEVRWKAGDELDRREVFIDRLLNCIGAFSPMVREQWDAERKKVFQKGGNDRE